MADNKFFNTLNSKFYNIYIIVDAVNFVLEMSVG